MKKIAIFVAATLISISAICASAHEPAAESTAIAADSAVSVAKIKSEKRSFIKFCADAYKWIDRNLMEYDSAYVVYPTYPFAIRPISNIWIEDYQFIGDGITVNMAGHDFLTAGLKLYYKSLSYGYNFNITQRDKTSKFKNYSFAVTTNMLEAALNFRINDVGTTITSIGIDGENIRTEVPFDGMRTKSLTVNLNYYFNYRRYSPDATFTMTVLQMKSAGSPFAGFNYENHRILFDPDEMSDEHATQHSDGAVIKFRNYMFTAGYGYNFVLPHRWHIGISDGLSAGITYGYSTGIEPRSRIGFSNNLRFGIGCNRQRWFVNFNLDTRSCWYHEPDFSLISHYLTAGLAIGYRFSIHI